MALSHATQDDRNWLIPAIPETRVRRAGGARPVRIDRRLLGWGLFLIIVGAIPLLVRGGYLDEALIDDWPSLWPLLLIGWGSLVLRRTPGRYSAARSRAVLRHQVGGDRDRVRRLPSFGAPAAGATTAGTGPDPLSDSGASGSAHRNLTVGAVGSSDLVVGAGPDVRPNVRRPGSDQSTGELQGHRRQPPGR
jgi:hypothetical protein